MLSMYKWTSKNNENHINIISADLYTSKCYIHRGEDYQEFCYTCNKNICKLCYEEHQDHDKEKIEGLDEDIIRYNRRWFSTYRSKKKFFGSCKK